MAFSAMSALIAAAALATVPGTLRTSAATFSIAVQGNHFVNGSGQTIRLLGVNRSGSEYMCTSAGGNTFDGPVDDASVASIAAWHTNAVRVPLNEDCWLGINGFPNGQTAASYQQAIIGFVNLLHAHGQYAILELHWNNGGTAQSIAQEGMADADHGPAFWTSVATAFKNDPAVVFDLYNEPHGITWDCWKNGGCADPVGGFTDAGMQALLNAVRATGATQPIMAGGLAYANDMSQWLAFKPTDPANALVASIHNYNFNQCITATCWDSVYKPIAASYPVVTGELGEGDCAHGYIDGYMNWADQNGVSYLGWAWNTYSCSTFPALISDFGGTPTAFGAGFQSHLAALAAAPSSASCPGSSAVPCYDHIFTILMENKPFSGVIGAPYISSLAKQGAVAGSYFATDHPSLPNYAELTSGQSFPNASSDCDPSSSCQSTATNIIDRVTASGRTWHSYQESMGSPCGKVTSYPYAPKHNPFVYYTDISAASCQANVVDYSNLSNDLKSSTLSNYVFITPNLCNDMHDCSVSTGDTWLSSNVPAILASSAFTSQKSLLVVVWDEDDGSQSNQVAWIAVGSGVKTNYTSSVTYNHYSYLRTIEASWGLSTLTTTDGGASVMSDVFGSVVVPPLAATAGASPTSGQGPLTVNFTGSASGGVTPYTYSWNFGDGTATSSAQSPSHAYATAGSFTAKLTVSDNAGHTTTANAPAVTVSLSPLTAGASANPIAGDQPLTVAFTGTAGGGMAPYSYSWNFGDGSAASTSQNPSHAYTAAGTDVAILTVTDGAATKATAQVTVVVSPTLSVGVSASPVVVDQGGSVSFTATPSGGLAPYGYSWNFGDGSAASTSQNPSHAYTSASQFTAVLTLTDANGVKATANVLVTVHSLPTVSAAASPSAGDAPVTVNLSASPSGGTTPYSYSWDFGDASALGTTQNPSHLYAAAGSYTAAVTLTDAAGHSVKGSVVVVVSPALSATAGASPTTGQAPLTVNLSASPSGGRTPYTYSWNFGDGTTLGTAQNPTHIYSNAATYTAVVTVTDANGAKVSAGAPAVTATPTVLTVVVSGSPTTGDAPLLVAFTAVASGGTAPLTYAWTFGDGSTGSGATPSHTYAAGSYVATVTATDAGSQKVTGQVTINVSPALTVGVGASPQAVDQSDNVTFSGNPGGGLAPYGYSWNFGDGSAAATTQNPVHAYNAAGTYTATLTVTDANAVKKTAPVQVVVSALPALTAAANPPAGDAPVNVSLTALPSGGTAPFTFSWSFGDGSAASTSQNPSHTYAAGSYTAQVTLTDAAGHTANSSVAITVSPTLGATAGASPTSGQAPLTVNLTATPTGGKAPYTYSWDFGDGSALSTSQNPAHVYASAGTFTAKVTVTDAFGSKVTASAPAVTVTIAPLVVSAAGQPTSGDAPVAVTFSTSATGGTAPLTFTWTFGDGTTGTGTGPRHTYGAAGTYVATLTVTDATAQSRTAQVTVVVSPALSVGVSASPLVVDQGGSISFTATPSGGLAPYGYSWNFGDGSAASTSQNPSHAYTSASQFTAVLTLTDANGVKATANVLVTVHSLPTVSAAASPSAGDAPVTVNLSASPSGGTTPYSYSWDFGDASALGTTQNPSHLYAAAGSYTAAVTLTDAAGHSVKGSVVVVVSPALSATAGASPTTGQAPLTVNLSASPSGGRTPYTYSWNFGDGTTLGTAQNPTHSYAGPGTFTAQVTVTDANGATVTVNAPATTVTPAPLVASATTSPTVGDAPLPTTLSGFATGGTAPFTYAWDLGDGSTSTQQTFSHTYSAGSYAIALTIHDAAGQSASVTTLRITVYSTLVGSTSATPITGTAPLQVAFSATGSGGLAPYTYSWAFGDATSGSGGGASHSYGTGTYYPTVTVHDAAGGTWTGSVARIAALAPPSSGGGGSNGTGAPASSGNPTGPTSAPTAAPTEAPAPSPSASPESSPTPSTAGSSPTGNDSGGNGPLLLTVLGTVLAGGLGGFLFVNWRRRRLV